MEATCFVCGTGEQSAVYLKCINEGQDKLVCVRCLPMLIHGSAH